MVFTRNQASETFLFLFCFREIQTKLELSFVGDGFFGGSTKLINNCQSFVDHKGQPFRKTETKMEFVSVLLYYKDWPKGASPQEVPTLNQV